MREASCSAVAQCKRQLVYLIRLLDVDGVASASLTVSGLCLEPLRSYRGSHLLSLKS